MFSIVICGVFHNLEANYMPATEKGLLVNINCNCFMLLKLMYGAAQQSGNIVDSLSVGPI